MNGIGLNVSTFVWLGISAVVIFFLPSRLDNILATSAKDRGQAVRLGWIVRPMYITANVIGFFPQESILVAGVALTITIIIALVRYGPTIIKKVILKIK
jgi:hypothetical protein